MNLSLRVVVIIFMLFSLQACEKETITNENERDSVEVTHEDVIIASFVENLTAALGYEQVRELVYKELQENKVGHQSVLVAKIRNSPLQIPQRPGVLAFNDFFQASVLFEKSVQSDLDDVLTNYPLLEIKLIDQYDKSSLKSEDLPIAYFVSPSGDPDLYSTYSNTIGWHGVDANEAPEKPHLFVGLNEEHFYLQGKELAKVKLGKKSCALIPTHSDDRGGVYVDHNDYYDYEDCVRPPEPSKPSGPISIPNPGAPSNIDYPCANADRESNENKDIFSTFAFDNRTALDDAFDNDNGWGNRTIELRVTKVFGDNNRGVDQTTSIHYIRKNSLKHNTIWINFRLETVTINNEVFTWQDEFHGINMLYQFSEMDGGKRGELNTSFSNVIKDPANTNQTTTVTTAVKVPFDENDENLQSKVVEYCDQTSGAGYLYNNGAVEFRVRQND